MEIKSIQKVIIIIISHSIYESYEYFDALIYNNYKFKNILYRYISYKIYLNL